MRQIIVLDTSPLGMISNPNASAENDAINEWVLKLLRRNELIVIPEIADYEVRRELIRSKKLRGIYNLDTLKSKLKYLPINTETMLEAAQLWAEARNIGKPATNNLALDGDMILIAQMRAASRVWAEEANGGHTILATTNVKHLTHFCDARLWRDVD